MRAAICGRCICIVFILTFACAAAIAQAPRELTVFAATSLTDAFEQLADAFMERESETRIVLNFSSSSRLAAQLLAGAPADVFASANDAQMQLVINDGRVQVESVASFATNGLILITPADNPARVESIADLAKPGLLLVLAVEGTPIRQYTDAMLSSHNADHGDDFATSALGNLVSEESNVRQVATRVALGEADAGIVYRSDAIGKIAESLNIIPIEPRHNQIASYPIALLNDAAEPKFAGGFIDFVLSADGQAILRVFGFCPPLAADQPATPTPTPDAEAVDPDADPPTDADECDATEARA